MATTVKVSEPTRDRIKAIGAETRQTAEQVVSRAIDEYERALFFEAYRSGVMARSAAEVAADDAEFAAWDRLAGDGLGDE